MDKLFNDDDLADVFAELNAEIDKHEKDVEELEDTELAAAQRRYEEIIRKRKEN